MSKTDKFKKCFIFVAFFLCLILSHTTCAAYSMSYPVAGEIEITSPYGWRIHPISGEKKYHSGIDFGTYEGDGIYAAQAGEVISAGWIEGYGFTVIIQHDSPDSVCTLYGHNQELLVSPGDIVRQGQPIAVSGSTGNSTGPHCHFECLIGDEPVDPAKYLTGLPALEQNANTSNPPQDDHWGNVEFDASFDIGAPIRNFISQFIDTITSALSKIKNAVHEIFLVLMFIDVAIALAERLLSSNNNEDLPNWTLSRILFFMLMLFLWSKWDVFVAKLALESFPALGAAIVGTDLTEAGKLLSDPTSIMQKGFQIITPVINDALRITSIFDITKQGIKAMLSFFFSVAFFFLFTIITWNIIKAYLVFYMTILFSFVNFMWAGNKYTRHFASMGLNGVFAGSINLMFFCIFAVMLNMMMQNIVVENLTVTTTQTQVEENRNTTGQIKSLSDCMERIRRVESYYGNYHCDNGKGYYGAYQMNIDYYDNWCQEYINDSTDTTPALDTDENYTRFTEHGAYDTAPEPTNTTYPWSPRNQDLIAAYRLQGFFNKYGSWEAACRAWNQGEGGMENAAAYEYQSKCLNKKASSRHTHTGLDFKILFQLLLVVLAFMMFGDRMSKRILNDFGRTSFRLTDSEKRY